MFDVNIFWKFTCLALTLIFFTHSFNLISLFFLVVIIACEMWKNRRFGLDLLMVVLTGTLLFYSVKKQYSGNLDAVGIIVKSKENYLLVRTFKSTFYIRNKDNIYEVGDIIHFSGKCADLAFFHYQESFNFAKYLNSYGAFTEIENAKISSIFCNPIRLRMWKNTLLSGYSDEAKSIVASMIFKESASGSQTYEIANDLGIGYLLSASNIHISFLFYVFSHFAKRKLQEKKIYRCCSAFLVLIYIFSEFSISIARILLMYLLSQVSALNSKWKFNYVERLSLSGIIILFFHPFYVLNIGFYYIFPTLIMFSFILNSFKKREKYKRLKISFVFFILMLPYQMLIDHSFNLLSVFFQALSAPLFSVIYLFDLLVFFGEVTRPFIEILNTAVASLLNKIPNVQLVVPVGNYSYIDALIYFSLILLILEFHELNLRIPKRVAVLCFISTLIFNVLPNFKDYYEVHFIDVGQGDSTLIRYKDKNFLIDTGGSLYVDLAKECLIPYFHKLKINKIDCLLTTHDDYDHVGAMESLLANFQVEQINRGGNQLKMQFDDFYIQDLNIFKDWSNQDTNYTSAVYYFQIFQTKFLIMGDAPIEIEKKLIKQYPELDCDVLKVGHHGSATSSCLEFLMHVSPDLAIISCGYNNIYHHPNQAVLDNLNLLDIPYIRTDISSTYIYNISA